MPHPPSSPGAFVALPHPPRPTVEALRAHVRAGARNSPGIYRMYGPAGEVLYVGKSVRVRTRLLSYFRADRGEKAAEIVGHAHRIDWEHLPSEFAALLREMELIKRWRPPFNVQHKADAAYCFIKLTREAAHRLLVVEQASADREENLIVSVDLGRIEVTRTHWPFLRDRRIDAYGDLTRRFID